MPWRARPKCRMWQCPDRALASSPYLGDHQPERKRVLDRQVLTKTWGRFRRSYLMRHPLCADCLVEHAGQLGLIRPAEIVHHLRPRREGGEVTGPDEWFVGLCRAHHSRRTNRGE